jgi:hypothetical protein
MIAASLSLAYEGVYLPHDPSVSISEPYRVLIGLLLGIVFILSTQSFLEKYEDLKFEGLEGGSHLCCA